MLPCLGTVDASHPDFLPIIPGILYLLLNNLISTFTPLGNSNFIKASTVLDEEL